MEYIGLIKLALYVIICVLLFLVLFFGGKREKTEQEEYLLHLMSNHITTGKFQKFKEKYELFISQYGADFNLGIIKVEQLIVIKICVILLFTILVSQIVEVPWSLIAGIAVGWKFPDFIIKLIDKEDNEKIFKDMKALYDTLRIQQSAGIYITTSLMHLYKVVRCKRLKAALKQLSSDILSEKNVEKAVNILSAKFKNEYINEFVSMVSQSVQTGQMMQMLNQINKQMLNFEEVMNRRREDAINRKMLIIIMLLFIGILALTMYAALGSDVMSSANFYN